MDENERRLHRRQLSADWQRQFEQQRFRQRGRLADRVGAALARLNNPDDTRAMRLVALLCFAMDACLCFAIVKRVPYTEVDWTAYMEQVDTFAAGERDYSAIHGGTGPLVYPAGHVYVFRTLQAITGGGDIQLAQRAFGALYLVNLALGLAVYVEGRLVPPWALPLLVLSKRLHSIFLLRLFNDGVVATLSMLAVLLMMRQRPCAALAAHSAAVSVKMSALLYAPAFALLLAQSQSLSIVAQSLALAAALQLCVGAPFLLQHPREYVACAFNFGRQFVHYWSVNFKWVPEATFSSKGFAAGLLGAHLLLLGVFAARRWAPHGRLRHIVSANLRLRTLPFPEGGHARAGATARVLLECNFAGIALARSLHFQFYAWYAHGLPALLWATRLPAAAKLLLWAAIEACWNPWEGESSTPGSSALLAACHALLLLALLAAPAAPGALGGGRGAAADASVSKGASSVGLLNLKRA